MYGDGHDADRVRDRRQRRLVVWVSLLRHRLVYWLLYPVEIVEVQSLADEIKRLKEEHTSLKD